MKNLMWLLVCLSFMFIGCVGLYADSNVNTRFDDASKTKWRSQSWPFMQYPADEKELTKFLADTSLYKDCVSKKGHVTQMYQDGMIGDLTLICEEKVRR